MYRGMPTTTAAVQGTTARRTLPVPGAPGNCQHRSCESSGQDAPGRSAARDEAAGAAASDCVRSAIACRGVHSAAVSARAAASGCFADSSLHT
eukprot:scaffold4037_cov400-Prasinococcus_capsulatus_cf.AAC.7